MLVSASMQPSRKFVGVQWMASIQGRVFSNSEVLAKCFKLPHDPQHSPRKSPDGEMDPHRNLLIIKELIPKIPTWGKIHICPHCLEWINLFQR
ncbi:hypothetical protein EI77_00778 [Prosthecobacter fusiformis]|uniref:Uncharacterized protein n=1 Tax=Prosthecobacter fusiformis TaxID=48464 RepID=A0A4R7SS32_9BACT|nr:hypothetical protein EI77_00778 [Prosthecobacter fusiformis]